MDKVCILCGAIDGMTYAIFTTAPMSNEQRKAAGYWPPVSGDNISYVVPGSMIAVPVNLLPLLTGSVNPYEVCHNCNRILIMALSIGIIDNTMLPPHMVHRADHFIKSSADKLVVEWPHLTGVIFNK